MTNKGFSNSTIFPSRICWPMTQIGASWTKKKFESRRKTSFSIVFYVFSKEKIRETFTSQRLFIRCVFLIEKCWRWKKVKKIDLPTRLETRRESIRSIFLRCENDKTEFRNANQTTFSFSLLFDENLNHIWKCRRYFFFRYRSSTENSKKKKKKTRLYFERNTTKKFTHKWILQQRHIWTMP